MIARFIQHLTLIAFTAHAVLGCCLHHSHADGAECRGEHVESEQESSHQQEGQCCHSHGDSACANQAAAVSGQPLLVIAAHYFDYSHEHSHHCNEPRCSFVSSSVKPANFASDLIVWDTFLDDFNIALLIKRYPASVEDHLFYRLADSSGQRCAILQSWQI